MARFLCLVLVAAVAAGCSATDPAPIRTGDGTLSAPASGVVLYSLRTDSLVTDSATTRWDLGVEGTELLLNGGSSGPGAAVGVVVEADYQTITDALADGYVYRRDGESPCPVGPPRAVCPGELVETVGGALMAVPGRTLLLRLGDGQGYAKLRVTGYDEATATYAFEYTVNPEGTAFEDDE